MAVLTTAFDTDFQVPAAGAFTVSCTQPVRLMRKIASGQYVPAGASPGGVIPPNGVGAGHYVGTNVVAGAEFLVQRVHPDARVVVEQ